MEEVTDMIQTNIIGVVYLTKLFIHRFDKRNCRSAIINVASIAGLVPIPIAQVYSATKMFLRSFTLAVGQEVSDKIREMSLLAFKEVSARGLSRVDFFYIPDTGDILINEINTFPGFTSLSMYPQLWKATGVEFPQLLDKLITLAQENR